MALPPQAADEAHANQPPNVDKLRDEIVECHKLRADFLKWKLVLVAVLAAAGLSGKTTDEALVPGARQLVLLLIPFVCVYADLMCLPNWLRVYSLRRFISNIAGPEPSPTAPVLLYEARLAHQDVGDMGFETFALLWSTLLIDMMVAFGGRLMGAERSCFCIDHFQGAASAGVALAIVVGVVFNQLLMRVDAIFPVLPPKPRKNRVHRRLAIGGVVAMLVILIGPFLAGR